MAKNRGNIKQRRANSGAWRSARHQAGASASTVISIHRAKAGAGSVSEISYSLMCSSGVAKNHRITRAASWQRQKLIQRNNSTMATSAR